MKNIKDKIINWFFIDYEEIEVNNTFDNIMKRMCIGLIVFVTVVTVLGMSFTYGLIK